MMTTRISLAVVVLLACSLLFPHASHAQGSQTRATDTPSEQQLPQPLAADQTEEDADDPIQVDEPVADDMEAANERPPLNSPKADDDEKESTQQAPVKSPAAKDDDHAVNEKPADDPAAGDDDRVVHDVPPAAGPTVNDDDQAAIGEPAPAAAPEKLSPEMIRLHNKVRTCLSYYYQRPTRVNERSPWGIMHSLISFGVDTELVAGNQRVNAIGWLCYNRPCKGMKLLTVDNGRLAARVGDGYQGHEGQLLSMLALSKVQITYPIRVGGLEFTVADLVELEQRKCCAKSELTFQLIGLAHYLDSDATWENDRGEQWSISRMIREELAQPVNGAACGGTHRLIGLSMAVKARVKGGKPLEGEWLRPQVHHGLPEVCLQAAECRRQFQYAMVGTAGGVDGHTAPRADDGAHPRVAGLFVARQRTD